MFPNLFGGIFCGLVVDRYLKKECWRTLDYIWQVINKQQKSNGPSMDPLGTSNLL